MLATKSFGSPDESRSLADHGRVDIVRLGDLTFSRATLEPGWRWSEHVKPVAGTASCQVAHHGVLLRGRLHVEMDDGTSGEAGPGEAYLIGPGHDAWVVGDEPVEFVDFSPQMGDYAKAG